jgi:hypothetical protein
MNHSELSLLADSVELMEIGRQAIENELVEWRDSRMFQPRNNGFVIRESNGEASSCIRFGPEVGVRIALKAIAAHLASDLTFSEPPAAAPEPEKCKCLDAKSNGGKESQKP